LIKLCPDKCPKKPILELQIPMQVNASNPNLMWIKSPKKVKLT
jgi:hypothetical protein